MNFQSISPAESQVTSLNSLMVAYVQELTGAVVCLRSNSPQHGVSHVNIVMSQLLSEGRL